MRCHTPLRITANGQQIPVGCGRCVYCKKRRVSAWVFRLLQEEKRSFSSHFITLTYDNDHLPRTLNNYKGLRKKDFQLFMKRLRKHQTSKIKYYAVGEYGEKTFRPHYHAIIFNLENTDLIEKSWTLGQVHIGDVTGASIAYTAKYIDKQKRIPLHRNDDRIKEFSLMSKGLGENYLTKQQIQNHKNDITRMYVVLPDGIKIAMPDYYRKKLFTDDEKEQQRDLIARIELEQEVKLRQKFEILYGNTDLTFDRYKETIKHGEYHKFYHNHIKRKL